MTIQRCLGPALLLSFTVLRAFCQLPPANDNYTNRTVLSGLSVSSTGNLANATLESTEPPHAGGAYLGGGSIWWTWTAPDSVPVVISLSSDWSASFNGEAMFEVFSGRYLGYLSLEA